MKEVRRKQKSYDGLMSHPQHVDFFLLLLSLSKDILLSAYKGAI
jgi:hypothetical protein